MFPLQLQADMLLPEIIGGILLAVVFTVVIMFALRRTRTMSDELSKEAKTKFDAIKPTSAPSGRSGETTAKPPQPSPSTLKLEGNDFPATLAQLQETRNRLQQLGQDYVDLKEKEATMHNELTTLRTEVGLLRDQLRAGVREIETLKASVQEQGSRFHDLKRSTEPQREEIKKRGERPELAAPVTPAQQFEKPTIPESCR
jgi:septal ring factor EnvC (AmiA/AmiB activator)